MKRPPTGTPGILDALSRSEADPATRRLATAFGGEPVAVRERLVGEPARRSRRLLFASGGEIILHDDAVAAVILHLAPTLAAPRGIDLSEWVAGADNNATLDDLKMAMAAPRHFAGIRTPYLTLGGGYARLSFDGSWNDRGNLLSIAFTTGKPGLTCRPEDDDCPTCSDLLVRRSDSDDGVDVDRTTAALAAALSAGLLTQDSHWVKLADLQPLWASGLMKRVESQLTCTTCRRIICFTLFRDDSPTFEYNVLNDARRRPLEAIPAVEQWGDASRVAAERDAMHYVDHEPGAWFFVEQLDTCYLDVRYNPSSIVDDSALIRLDDSERDAYRTGGHDYLSTLAEDIKNHPPSRETSPYHQRDLYRGPDSRSYRDAVGAAIVNHTWIAQQRRTPQESNSAEKESDD